MHIAIVANGDFSITPAIQTCFFKADKLLACDNGASFCDNLGRLPDVVLGDLDSLPHDLQLKLRQAGVLFEVYPVDKAMTDLDIALHHAVLLKPHVITVLGALGGRWDQSFANLLLLTHPTLRHIPTVIRASTSSIILLQPGWRYQWRCPPETVFSVLPITDVTGVTLTGARYALTNTHLQRAYTLPVSNAMQREEADIQLAEGFAWLVVNASAPRFYFECLDNMGHPGKIADLDDTFSE